MAYFLKFGGWGVKRVRAAAAAKKHADNVKRARARISLVTGDEPHTVPKPMEKDGIKLSAGL